VGEPPTPEVSMNARTLAVLLACALLPSCGSDRNNNPTPVPTPTPVPPAVSTVVSTGSGSVPVRILAFIPFSTTAAGRLDVTVDWTFATNDVDVYLVRGACVFEQFVANQCAVATFSESASAKPERLTLSGAAAGSYELLIGNRGPTDESVAFQVVLTTGGVASVSTGRSGTAARAGEYTRAAIFDRR
jgi:hypothetical protein